MREEIDFAKMCFNKKKMKEYLPQPIYQSWKKALRLQEDLDRNTADAIAHAMKEWAISMGASHYSHLFYPLNGLSARKLESFLDRSKDNEPIYHFSGAELIKSEPDASSFPSGGMRSTFEARGYAYWDLSANSFIENGVLYIPSIFVSYTGESLDKRAPLLRATEALSKAGTRLLNILDRKNKTYRMKSKLGLEQEFFLIDKDIYKKRIDLQSCGRTLVGSLAVKGQTLEDHYFGRTPKRVEDFYKDVNKKLWELGIYAKTEHNEVAPCQFELAVLYENTNVAIDDNQLVMSILTSTALEHNLVCLLHEKPFAGVNGSGKHNNYSITNNYGLNCFNPGKKPEENLVFLLFTAAMIELVDRAGAILRVVSSGPSNDYRLGGNEAPPSIMSIFLGQDIQEIFEAISLGKRDFKSYDSSIRVSSLGDIPKDRSDRNRTSPMAFTGNKFEFRMLGSSRNASDVNVVLNTFMADILDRIADLLEGVSSKNLKDKSYEIIEDILKAHGKVMYTGDNYSTSWKALAEKRGLRSFDNLFQALVFLKNDENLKVFEDYKIFSRKELKAIYDVYLEEIINYHTIEARACINLIDKDILPSALREISDLKNSGLKFLEVRKAHLEGLLEALMNLRNELSENLSKYKDIACLEEKAKACQIGLADKLLDVRKIADEMEDLISKNNYSLVGYDEIFNSLI